MARTINELTVEELQNVINELSRGTRYNEIKAKYNLASNAVNANTSAECAKLIAERAPKEPVVTEKKFTGYANVKNQTAEQQAKLLTPVTVKLPDGSVITGGCATVDANGDFVW